MDPVPLVSVILPTYNRMAYLPQAVESVLRQTENRWELLVADDGSTDQTSAYLDQLADPRIRVLRLTHSGHPETVRNAALVQARGPFVAFLDSDDWWEPEKLSSQLAALAGRPECGWSYTALRRVDQDGQELPVPRFVPLEGMVLERFIAGGTLIITSTIMVRRELLAAAGGFNTSLTVASDFDLWTRLAERSPVVAVDRALTTRRRHPGNYGAAHRENLEAVEEVFRRLVARASTARLRRLALKQRARWLAGVANRRRNEGLYGAALRSLLAACPHGLMVSAWWVSSLKTLTRPVLPETVLSLYRRARRRLMARGSRPA